jgi:transposase-like protein
MVFMPKPTGYRPPYPAAFGGDAVALVRSSSRPSRELATELGVSYESLRLWCNQAEIDAGNGEGFRAMSVRSSASHSPPGQGGIVLAAADRRASAEIAYSSRLLNLVERWFAELTTKWIKRGSHRSVRDLVASIRTWITNWNDEPRPYVWHKDADEILEGLAGYCQRINDSGH